MLAVVRLIFLTAVRDRIFLGLSILMILTFGVSLFLGSSATLEQREAGIVFAAGTVRVLLVLGSVIFVAFQTQRLFESREIEAILSRSLSRSKFVVAYWLGFAAAALALTCLVAGILFVLYGYSNVSALWTASLLLECLVVLAFVVFAGLTFERATSTVFVTAAFYAFTRLIGFFLGIRDATPDVGANKVLNPMLDALGYLLPRLDLMTQTSWLVYGLQVGEQLPTILAQAVFFILIALTAAAFDLAQREF